MTEFFASSTLFAIALTDEKVADPIDFTVKKEPAEKG